MAYQHVSITDLQALESLMGHLVHASKVCPLSKASLISFVSYEGMQDITGGSRQLLGPTWDGARHSWPPGYAWNHSACMLFMPLDDSLTDLFSHNNAPAFLHCSSHASQSYQSTTSTTSTTSTSYVCNQIADWTLQQWRMLFNSYWRQGLLHPPGRLMQQAGKITSPLPQPSPSLCFLSSTRK